MPSDHIDPNIKADEKAVAAANGLGGGGILEAAESPTQEEYEAAHVDPTVSSSSSQHTDDDDEPRDVELAQVSSGPAYTVFSKNKKRFIIFMAMAAGFFSPFSANIYFPALNVIAADLHVTNALVNLTLTTYMIFQGLAPTYVYID